MPLPQQAIATTFGIAATSLSVCAASVTAARVVRDVGCLAANVSICGTRARNSRVWCEGWAYDGQ